MPIGVRSSMPIIVPAGLFQNKRGYVVKNPNNPLLYTSIKTAIIEVLTKANNCDMIWERDKRNTTEKNVEPNEGERTLLSRNKGGTRSPSLDFLDTSADNVTENMILDYLASIISDIYMHETYGNKESSDILPGINEGTS